jgi:4-aminobutyrate aminotransferase-like enzyme
MGLVMGLEFVKDKRTKEPFPQMIRPLMDACANNGLLIGSVGMFGNVVRVAPPLVITKAEIDESVAILDKVLAELSARTC